VTCDTTFILNKSGEALDHLLHLRFLLINYNMNNLDIIALLEDDGYNNQMNNMFHFILNELMEPLPELNELEVGQRGERPRNQNYYEVIIPQYDDMLFKDHFRMSRATFEVHINLLNLF